MIELCLKKETYCKNFQISDTQGYACIIHPKDLTFRDTEKSLINTHALINALPTIWTLKIVIFWAIFGKILASYKRPSEKMGGGVRGTDLFFCSKLPN